MKSNEIVRALRCVSTAGGENACEHCPYWKEEEVPEEERPIYGADTMHSCDVDRVGLDGADLIERLTARCARYAEEIAVAQERQRWIPVEERLPEDRSDVLVVAYWHERWGVYMGWCAPERAEWSVHIGIGDRDDVAVTYWMPLPEPPKEDDRND